MKQPSRTIRQTGFTLIEMMTVLLIVAVLTTFAYPSYRQARLKAARAEGRAALMRLMQQQERYYTAHHRYRHFDAGNTENGNGGNGGERSGSTPGGAVLTRFSGATAAASSYFLEARACESEASGSAASGGDAQGCLLLRAIPANGFSDSTCGVLTLDSAGRQDAAGSGSACR